MFALFPFRLYSPVIPKIASIHVVMRSRSAAVGLSERSVDISMRRRHAEIDMTETEDL